MISLKSFIVQFPVLVSSFSLHQNHSPLLSHSHNHVSTQLFAESGPPQYEKFNAVLDRVEMVSEGSAMLHIKTEDAIEYKAGNVLALEIEGEGTTEKSKSDSAQNEEWMRGPYTVSRATEKSFDVLVKVVGDKSKTFASAPPGTPVRFGGKFKVPIIDGVEVESTKRVVLLSTGVGVGPCIGAIEESMKKEKFPPIELYASYRMESEIVCADYLDSMNLKWKAIVTGENGRISADEKNIDLILPHPESGLSLSDTHYHLIGNGQMVKEWKDGLIEAGVPENKVTVEMYHNFRSDPDGDVIKRIAKSVSMAHTSVVN